MGLLLPKLRWAWALAGAAGLALVLAGMDRLGREPQPAPVHGAWETDPALWGRQHPRPYDTWKQGRDAHPSSPLEALDPGLFAGHGAGADGVEPASQGHPAACQTCHDPATMGLRVTQPAFLQALARQGLEPARLERSVLRTYVCAQCHSIRTRGLRGGLPDTAFSVAGLRHWAEAPEPTEWRHALSGTPLLRVRHPEFELWREGIHAKRNVACADCHMPQVAEGSVRFTDHSLGSPMTRAFASCMGCHHGGEAALRGRVKAMQGTTQELQVRAARALRAAHGAVARVPDSKADALRTKVRQAQLRWNAVASDGSGGFHAPQESARLLGEAIDLARQAEVEAQRF